MRLLHDAFVERYHMLVPGKDKVRIARLISGTGGRGTSLHHGTILHYCGLTDDDSRRVSTAMLASLDLPSAGYEVGETKVFFRSSKFCVCLWCVCLAVDTCCYVCRALRDAGGPAISSSSHALDCHPTHCPRLCGKAAVEATASSAASAAGVSLLVCPVFTPLKTHKNVRVCFQSVSRGMLARRLASFMRQNAAACKVQARIRAHLAQGAYQRLRGALMRLQAHQRGSQARARVLELRRQRAAVALQSIVKGHRQRSLYKVQRGRAVRLQVQVREGGALVGVAEAVWSDTVLMVRFEASWHASSCGSCGQRRAS